MTDAGASLGRRGAPPPYRVEMDAAQARELVQNGATLLLLDVPEGTAVGLDHQMFLSGPKLKGVKMIPPGVHALTYYAVGSMPSGFSAPTSRWMALAYKEVVVLRWDPETELLTRLPDEDEEGRYVAGVRAYDFDSGLAPYNLSAYGWWREMAGAVSASTLRRTLPECVNINVSAEVPPPGSSTAAEKELEMQLRNRDEVMTNACEAEGTAAVKRQQSGQIGRCSYTKIPLKVHGPGLTPSEITAANLDRTKTMEHLIATELQQDDMELMAEFQMAFVNFVMGHSLEGYSQWKECLRLVCTCGEAVNGRLAPLVVAFSRTFLRQLQVTLEEPFVSASGMEAPTPFGVPMVEELLATSFLRPMLAGWFEELEARQGLQQMPELQELLQQLRTLLSRRLGIDFHVHDLDIDEDNEYAPVVVET